MKPMLEKKEMKLYYYDKNGSRIEGCGLLTGDVSGITGDVSHLTGNVSGLRGDVSGITGDVSGITGDVSHLTGNVSGLTGNVSGLTGDVDKCEITDEERKCGIEISSLIKVQNV